MHICQGFLIELDPVKQYNEIITELTGGKIMNLGNSLLHARKKTRVITARCSRKLGVSRQTISKWETGETIPDIRQCKRLAVLYQMSLDELIDFDINTAEIQEMIKKSGEKADEKINWTNEWGKISDSAYLSG